MIRPRFFDDSVELEHSSFGHTDRLQFDLIPLVLMHGLHLLKFDDAAVQGCFAVPRVLCIVLGTCHIKHVCSVASKAFAFLNDSNCGGTCLESRRAEINLTSFTM